MNGSEARILEALASFDMTRLLHELVGVPSPVGEEGCLAERIGEKLAAAGFDVRYQEVDGARRNVIAAFEFPRKGPCLMFDGHLDTVLPGTGWNSDPYRGVEREGRLYGLGALDMKGGTAASLAALISLVASRAPLCGTAMFSGVVDEEGCSDGARALVDAGMDEVDAIVIGEPCFGSEASPIPVLTPGKVLYRVTVTGEAAHGFLPREGINAVEEAARIVSALGRLRQTECPGLGRGPVSTLKIAGGYEKYAVVVPEHCEVVISRMIVPGETREQCVADLEALIASLDLRAKAEVELVPPYYVPLQTDTSGRLFRVFEGAYRDEFRRPPVYKAFPIITDASVFCGLGGIPTLVFGPAGGGIHKPNEYVDLESLAGCARTYARTAARFLGGEGL